jgi:hypothetical protein
MAAYMTRVELHNASYTDYETLHAAMEKEGFERTITSSQGAKYHLPTAEYYRITNLSINDVLQSAERAANVVRKNYSVVVSETVRVTWNGLNQA